MKALQNIDYATPADAFHELDEEYNMFEFLRWLFYILDGLVAVHIFLDGRRVGMGKEGLIFAFIISSPIWWSLSRKSIRALRLRIPSKEELYYRKIMKGSKKARKERERKIALEEERRNSVCLFEDGITKEEFDKLAHAVAKRIKRLHIDVNGPVIFCKVDSQSGISTWEFDIDFNDFGHITGAWWIMRKENHDSKIPERYAELMEEAIKKRWKQGSAASKADPTDE